MFYVISELLLIDTIYIVIGLLVYSKNSNTTKNLIFLLNCFASSVWSMTVILLSYNLFFQSLKFLVIISFISLSIIQANHLQQIYLIINKKRQWGWQWILIGTYLVTTIFISYLAFFNITVSKASDRVFADFFSAVYITCFLTINGLSSLLVYLSTGGKWRDINRARYLYSLTGLNLAAFGPYLFLSPGSYNYHISLFFIFLYAAATAYILLFEKTLLDFRYILKNIISYTAISSLIAGTGYIIISIEQYYLYGRINNPFLLNILFLLLFSSMTVLLLKTKSITRPIGLTSSIIKYSNILNSLTKSMTNIFDVNILSRNILDTIAHNFGIKNSSIYLLDDDNGTYNLLAYQGVNFNKGREIQLTKEDFFISWLLHKKDVVTREYVKEHCTNEAEETKILEKMDKMGSDICFPLISNNKLIGICNLRKWINKDILKEEIDIITTFSTQAAIVFENIYLCESLKRSNIKIRHSDRLASLGTLTAGLAHEIRNPLVSIKTFLQLLPERFEDKDFRYDFLDLTTNEFNRICKLVEELLSFASPSEPSFKPEDINLIVNNMVMLINNEAKKKNIRISKVFSKGILPVKVDGEQIKQVLMNIFINAIQSMESTGELKVETTIIKKNGQELVQIEVKDTGVGIPKEDMDSLFNPFFSKKQKGTGLGLSIAHQIISEHNGFIDVESELGIGTVFFIVLPFDPMKHEIKNNSLKGKNKREEVKIIGKR